MDKKLEEKRLFLEKANAVVSKLSCETINDTSEFIALIKLIEPYHYEEIVEERFISKLCGYPLCFNELKNIPEQKYKISAKTNQVYELTDRKVIYFDYSSTRFCNASCFKASKFVEAQIPTTPVWSRQSESGEIKLWEKLEKTDNNKPSNHIPKSNNSIAPLIETKTLNDKLEFEELDKELREIENQWKEKYQDTINKPTLANNNTRELKAFNSNFDSSEEILKRKSEHLKKKFLDSIEIDKKPNDLTILKSIFNFEVLDQQNGQLLQFGHGPNKFITECSFYKNLFLIEFISQRLAEMLTHRTKEYLLDSESREKKTVKEEREEEEYDEMCNRYVAEKEVILNDMNFREDGAEIFNPISVNFNNKNIDEGEAEMIAKLKGFEHIINQSVAKKAKSPELPKPDISKVEINQESVKTDEFGERKKPLPDYEQLKEDAIRNELKIKEFFSSARTKAAAKKEQVTLIEEDESSSGYNQKMIFKIKETDEQIVRIFPSVDSQSQVQIRRNIFYDKLIIHMEQLLKFSNFTYVMMPLSLKDHVKNFIFSLKLCLKQNVKSEYIVDLIRQDKLIETMLDSFKLNQETFEIICKALVTRKF